MTTDFAEGTDRESHPVRRPLNRGRFSLRFFVGGSGPQGGARRDVDDTKVVPPVKRALARAAGSAVIELDVGYDAVAGAVEDEDVADGGLEAGDLDALATDDGGQGEFAGVAEVAEGVFETAGGHVGEFADDVFDEVVIGEVGVAAGGAEDVADGVHGEAVGETEVDDAAGFAHKADVADDVKLGAGGVQVFGGGFFHEDGLALQHGAEDVVHRQGDGFLDEGVVDGWRGGNHVK